jgi:hypothetical protein
MERDDERAPLEGGDAADAEFRVETMGEVVADIPRMLHGKTE